MNRHILQDLFLMMLIHYIETKKVKHKLKISCNKRHFEATLFDAVDAFIVS